MSQEKCTIQAAAKALNVTTKTIYRYLSNGTLSKVKEGTRTYILVDEVRKMRSEMSETQKDGVMTDQGHGDKDSITISLKQYTDLIDELGQYKGQVIGQTKYLIEYKEGLQAKDRELEQARGNISTQAQELAGVRSALATNAEELAEAKGIIIKARNELQQLLKVKQDAEQKAKVILDQQTALEARERENKRLMAENERLKRLRWWERLFRRGI